MTKFEKNPNPIMKKGPFKMKYKHSAFPFKGSPAKFGFLRKILDPAGIFDRGDRSSGKVPPHTHGDEGGAATSASVAAPIVPSASSTSASGLMSGIGRRTVEGEV